MKSRDIMFWSFDHLQKYLDALMNAGVANKEFVEYLFNLMLHGMLYNDSLRVRPELRALLRFGSYHKLAMDEHIIFEDETLKECMLAAHKDPHHGLAPFNFYMDQFAKYIEQSDCAGKEVA